METNLTASLDGTAQLLAEVCYAVSSQQVLGRLVQGASRLEFGRQAQNMELRCLLLRLGFSASLCCSPGTLVSEQMNRRHAGMRHLACSLRGPVSVSTTPRTATQ